jgi:hypothetical protein
LLQALSDCRLLQALSDFSCGKLTLNVCMHSK